MVNSVDGISQFVSPRPCDIAQHFHGWLVAKTRMSYVPHFLPKKVKELVDPDQAPPPRLLCTYAAHKDGRAST